MLEKQEAETRRHIVRARGELYLMESRRLGQLKKDLKTLGY